MQSFLAKCAALGIVAGGFALTGDMGRLADRGRRLLDAPTVPSEMPAEPTVETASASEPTRSMPQEARADAPVGRAVSVPAPPALGPDSIDLRQVTAGSRLLIWIRRPGAPARSVDLIALDIIDPVSGEALEHRHAALTVETHETGATAVYAAPRRVVITGNAVSRITKGSPLRIAPLHGVNGLGTEEHVGTILAFSISAG